MQQSIPPTIHPSCSTAVPGPTAIERSFCTLHGLSRRLGTTPASRSSPQVDPGVEVMWHPPLLSSTRPSSPSLLTPQIPPSPELLGTQAQMSPRLQAVFSLHVDILIVSLVLVWPLEPAGLIWRHIATAGPRALNISI